MRPEVSFVYGDRDWMRSRGADRVAREIGADVHTIENAGHLMYIENYEHFNSVAASILQRRRRQKYNSIQVYSEL